MAQENPHNPLGRLTGLFHAGIAAIRADAMLPAALPAPAGRLLAIAIGKAAVPLMAAAQARANGRLEGLVVAPHGHVPPGTGWPGVRIITAGHPVPDADSIAAGEAALALAAGLGADDHLLMLVSGGGSAVLAAPVAGVTLAEKAAVTRALLRSGATIADINTVRQALSRIKGGGLAAMAAPAAVTTWIISDIPGDHPGLVASGPTVPGDARDARAIVERFGIVVPPGVGRALEEAERASGGWGPKFPGRPQTPFVIARPRDALDAIARDAAALGYTVIDLGDTLEGEARDLGAAHAALALGLTGRHAILSGGETSVTITGTTGRGGRNLEYALALAIGLNGAPGITALAADSDGIDGSSHAAGAFVTPDTLTRGPGASAYLAAHDAHGFFESVDGLFVTGPTLTNVNDLRLILVDR